MVLGCQSTAKLGTIEIQPEASRHSFSQTAEKPEQADLICTDVFTYFNQKHVYRPDQAAYLLISNLPGRKIRETSVLELGSLGYKFASSQDIHEICSIKNNSTRIEDIYLLANSHLQGLSAKMILVENLGIIYSWNIEDSHHDYNYWKVDRVVLESIDSRGKLRNWQVGLDSCRSTRQMTRAEFASLLSKELFHQLKMLFSRNEPFIEMDIRTDY